MTRLSLFQRITALFILFIAVMIACRIIYSGSIRYIFILWNLFLAWIPFQVSLLLSKLKTIKNIRAIIILSCWLLFFPNALYVVTDLIHLEEENSIPVWYDAIMLFMASLTGLMLAFVSLYKVEKFLRLHIKSRSVTEQLIVFFLFAGSFGVYLGRFDRWNSWDVITYPVQLFKETAAYFISPLQHYRIWLITIIFTAFFSLLYFTVKKLPVLIKGPGNN